MKVICINNIAKQHEDCKGTFLPKEGKAYTVTETVNWYGLNWYLLKEDKLGNGWNPAYFIPIAENKFDTVSKKNAVSNHYLLKVSVST